MGTYTDPITGKTTILAQTVGTTYASSGNCSTGDCGCFCSLLVTPNWN
jgi:hypothetical protein